MASLESASKTVSTLPKPVRSSSPNKVRRSTNPSADRKIRFKIWKTTSICFWNHRYVRRFSDGEDEEHRWVLPTNVLYLKERQRMKILSKVIVGCAALVLFGCFSGSAYADGLVLVSADIQKLAPPISALNFEHHGARKTESGGVRWNGTQDVSFGDISAGPHQQTVSLTDLGIGRASDLRVLLNINEANGGAKMPITVNSLVLTAFDQKGNSIFSASLINGPISLDQFKQAQGSSSDYVFGLDSEAAARLQAAIARKPTLR